MGRKPESKDVLDCLAADASGAQYTFEEWAAEYGYSDDSRKAYHTYRVIRNQSIKLRAFLEEDAFLDLINNVERL